MYLLPHFIYDYIFFSREGPFYLKGEGQCIEFMSARGMHFFVTGLRLTTTVSVIFFLSLQLKKKIKKNAPLILCFAMKYYPHIFTIKLFAPKKNPLLTSFMLNGGSLSNLVNFAQWSPQSFQNVHYRQTWQANFILSD